MPPSTLFRCLARTRSGTAWPARPASTMAPPLIASIHQPSPGVVAVTFDGAQRSAHFHVPWLRDHCPSAAHPLTGQRALALRELPQTLSPAALQRCASGQRLRIAWPCGHASAFSAAWLQRYAYWWDAGAAAAAPPAQPPLPPEAAGALAVAAWWRDAASDWGARRPWGAATFAAGALPAVPYSAFMAEGGEGLRAALRLLRDVGFVVVEGAPPSEAATQAACLRIGFLRPTLYGPGMWRTEVRPPQGGGVTDTAFTSMPLPLHTDGNYLGEPPGLQVFHCTRPDASGGGDSLLMDGLALSQAVARADPAAHELLTLWPLPYHHTGVDGIVGAARPVFALGADGQVEGVHYNAADRGPVMLPPSWGRELRLARALTGSSSSSSSSSSAGVRLDPTLQHPATAIPALYAALGVLEGCLEDASLLLRLPLRPGMLLIFDNHRVLHGRAGFDVTSGRTLVGCYMGRDEWSSRLREVELPVGTGTQGSAR